MTVIITQKKRKKSRKKCKLCKFYVNVHVNFFKTVSNSTLPSVEIYEKSTDLILNIKSSSNTSTKKLFLRSDPFSSQVCISVQQDKKSRTYCGGTVYHTRIPPLLLDLPRWWKRSAPSRLLTAQAPVLLPAGVSTSISQPEQGGHSNFACEMISPA